MTRRQRFLLALLPAALVIAFLVARAEWTARQGTRVVLEIGAVDPIDPLRGRYLRTPVVIAALELAELELHGALPAEGARVFVRLEEGDPWWRATAVAPAPGAGVWLAGELAERDAAGGLRIDYGLERYYLPAEIDDPARARDAEGGRLPLGLVVRVGAGGRAVVEGLQVGGRPLAEWSAGR